MTTVCWSDVDRYDHACVTMRSMAREGVKHCVSDGD